ncbi:MAG: hypothetical protein ABI587_08960 [Gemmatimonadales bacterium]
MARSRIAAALTLVAIAGGLTACTELMAGPATSTSSVIPAGRDSTWVRARRAMAADFFTLDIADSVGGVMSGVRHPKPGVLAIDPYACRLHVTYALAAGTDSTPVEVRTQWTAPANQDHTPTVDCAPEMADVVSRMDGVVQTGH